MAPIDDSREARIKPTCPPNIAELLSHAWQHDRAALKPLLRVPGPASVQEPTTGETPLHAAIRACGPSSSDDVKKAAAAVVSELFMSGAIWNDVDDHNETPGCVAARLGLHELYTACMEAGVRAELLFGLLDGYEELESENADEEGDIEIIDIDEGDEAPELATSAATTTNDKEQEEEEKQEEEETTVVESDPDRAFKPTATETHTVTSRDYLQSTLTYSDGKLVDSADNGVMMAWETSIMRASVDSLLGPELPQGKKILNIGFGMGIIDSMFAATRPARHHIIEAHPAVLAHIQNNSVDSLATAPSEDTSRNFGSAWESSGPEDGAYKVHAGRWQDVVPQLMEAGETYDAVYFDTFGEDYAQLRHFFTEHVPYMLTETGAFGFFNGLGADRKICYDVYTRVSEMHLSDAGLDVEWQELDVDMQGLGKEGEGEWEGVKRRYWTLEKYQLPRCTLMG
ncbi:arginine N-methyltransferase 2 [Microdochium bolleyi]|uniref:Arginine N-methyltransferase 2 n=1 Tax=Microdochium bolleyi TaxID=196109 RepID=A0A136JFU2_9PEZI|nr:arginine N-methyltransferase 2 [Microdochium bolleyi]